MKEKPVKATVVQVEIVSKRCGSWPVGMVLPLCPADARKLIDSNEAKAVEK